MRKEIRVQRQVQWTDDGQMEIRGPKYGSERTVYVPEALVTMLAEHLRLYQPGDDPDRWLFPGARNDQLPAHAATVARWWRKVRDKIGMEHRLLSRSGARCQCCHGPVSPDRSPHLIAEPGNPYLIWDGAEARGGLPGPVVGVRPEVAVGVQGDRRRRVPERPLDRHHVAPSRDQTTGVEVPQIVRAP